MTEAFRAILSTNPGWWPRHWLVLPLAEEPEVLAGIKGRLIMRSIIFGKKKEVFSRIPAGSSSPAPSELLFGCDRRGKIFSGWTDPVQNVFGRGAADRSASRCVVLSDASFAFARGALTVVVPELSGRSFVTSY